MDVIHNSYYIHGPWGDEIFLAVLYVSLSDKTRIQPRLFIKIKVEDFTVKVKCQPVQRTSCLTSRCFQDKNRQRCSGYVLHKVGRRQLDDEVKLLTDSEQV